MAAPPNVKKVIFASGGPGRQNQAYSFRKWNLLMKVAAGFFDSIFDIEAI